MKYLLPISLLILLFACQSEPKYTTSNANPIQASLSKIRLEPIPAAQSNITFNNELIEHANLNIFIWNFLYSGAGVATGDLNNDGKPDIYFAGNQVADKIYLNKGAFAFEDITAKSGINPDGWTTGVTMADVNGDGLLDIYVCKNSPTAIAANNRNRLYINQSNGVFKEEAEKYGLADIGFGIQGSFFDIDNDGDLDMYLVNQPFDNYAKLVNDPQLVARQPTTDRIFINNDGVFQDHSRAYGISNNKYGLNVALGDFNLDGWTDFYVCNDYDGADHLYMNISGRPKDEIQDRTAHISRFAMGADVADINQDGWLDIFTLDMAFQSQLRSKTNMESMDPTKFWATVNSGEHHQYAQNNLQLNRGNGQFTEIAQLLGLAKTDWSAAPLFVDLDNDGWQDVLITNGILRDLKNNDYRQTLLTKYGGQVGPENLQDAMAMLPSNPVPNILYKNLRELEFQDISDDAGFNFSGYSHGIAYSDFDNDGRMDVVVNNMSAPASIYKNNSENVGAYLTVSLKGPEKNTQGLGATVIAIVGSKTQVGTMQTTRGFLSASEATIHFGFRHATQLDTLKILWNNQEMTVFQNVSLNKKIKVDYGKSNKIKFNPPNVRYRKLAPIDKIQYAHQEKTFDDYEEQVLLPYKLSQNGPFIAHADVNQDGFEDIFIGGAAGQIGQIHLQTELDKFAKSIQPTLQLDFAREDQEANFADMDQDGDLDLVVSSGSNEFSKSAEHAGIRAYENIGLGVFQKFSNFSPEEIKINSQCQVLFDADGDDDLDLLVAGRMIPGKYPLAPASQLWINQGGSWSDETQKLAPFLKDLGMVTDAIHEDLDGDGDQDVLLAGEWMVPTLMINQGGNGFEKKELANIGTGLWWTMEKMDADDDGDQDILLGNLGWNNKFGGAGKPKLEVYSDDFDNNGDHDVVLAVNTGEHIYPVRGRECSSQEMPFVLDKFPNYAAYGEAELNDLLSRRQIRNSTHKKIETFTSMLLLNEGNLNFKALPLPQSCQYGPIKAFEIIDINQDGHLDFFFGGNHFPTEVETARYDGLKLGLCLGRGDGKFNYYPNLSHGIAPSEDIRDLEIIQLASGKQMLLVAINNAPSQEYLISW